MSAATTRIVPISVSEPWFTAICAGVKVVEARLNKGKFVGVRAGDLLQITKSDDSEAAEGNATRVAAVAAVVTGVDTYASFSDMLTQQGLARTLPGTRTIAQGVSKYYAFYSKTDEKEKGVLAIQLRVLSKY